MTIHRVVLAVADLIDELEPLGEVLDLLLAAGVVELVAQFDGQFVEVERSSSSGWPRRPSERLERVAVLLDRPAVLVLGENLLVLSSVSPGSMTT
jgi:hypothetical protein